MNRRAFLAGLSTAVVAGCLGGSEGSSYDVGMTAAAFRPREYEASVGDTVVWRNTSSRAHTVTAYDDGVPDGASYFASGGFESESAARQGYADGLGGAIYSGETYEHTFEVPGTYSYFCVPHERAGMVGRIVVG